MKNVSWFLLSAMLLMALPGCQGCNGNDGKESTTVSKDKEKDKDKDKDKETSNDDDQTPLIVGSNLPPAPQPDLSGAAHIFHVAALEVQLPLPKGPVTAINAKDFEWIRPQSKLQVGDVVQWVSKEGFHGVTFTNWPQAQQVLRIEGGKEIKRQPQHGADARGTDAAEDTLLIRASIIDIPQGVTEIPFICTEHGPGMSGKLLLEAGPDQVPILAYVHIVTDMEKGLAAEITQLTRTLDKRIEQPLIERMNQALQDDPSLGGDKDRREELWEQFYFEETKRLETPIEEKVIKLRGLLRSRFRDRPEPLVLRVPAPAQGEAPVKVGVKLINLLPSEMEIEDRFGRESPFGGVWSPVTSLHASLVRYDVQRSHGSGAGMNLHSLCVRGDTRKYLWSVDRELGVCCLGDMADPEHQTAGLFGALIVEPDQSTFQNATADQPGDMPPGWQAIVRPSGSPAFREFVIFVHDDFIGSRASGGFAINYYSAADASAKRPPTPVMSVHAGDSVIVRQVHAAGTGDLSNHSFFIGGRRWPFDIENIRSNHIAAIAQAPWSAFNIRFNADPDVDETRTYLYGSHVANQITRGEWGLLKVLKKSNNTILSIP